MSGFSPERSALRGLGSSAVVTAHVAAWGSAAVALSPAWAATSVVAQNLGWVGVGLFLTLSIYLLMGSLDAGTTLSRYFRRRVVRIWPLYFATCGALFVLGDPSWTHLAWNLTFLAVFNPSEQFYGHGPWTGTYVVWTLQIEEWAYLLFPVVAWLGRRDRALVGFGLVGFGVVLVRAGPVDYFTPWPWLACYGFGLLAYERFLPYSSAWFALAAVPFFVPQVGWPLGLILVGPALACVVAYPPTFLRRRVLTAVGESSYALYLTHLLWLDYVGPIGVALAYPFAWSVESIQRGREMRRRVRSVPA